MFFSDVHVHLLYGVDDGARSSQEMFAMVDKLYSDGVRFICATPHCHPRWCGDNRDGIEKAFQKLCRYCTNKYPDLMLGLGNELYFERDGLAWIKNGFCKTLNSTRYILVEFDVDKSESGIIKALQSILNAGYIPILAHAERYVKLSIEAIKQLRHNGIIIQINARKSLFEFNFNESFRVKRILSNHLVDLISSDAHNLRGRPPYIKAFYNIVSKKYGVDYAKAIFCDNAVKMLFNNREDKK